ncbi:MAG: rRNA pseudouridine synthase, partial [Bacteroidetes bacterium]|nr:rRNA pseudouridine synthase [Bacteroidota bacterium]
EGNDSEKRSFRNKKDQGSFSKGRRLSTHERYNETSENDESNHEYSRRSKSSVRTDGKNRLLKGKRKKDDKSENTLLPADSTIRLNRYIANSGICSRREADDMIGAGLVSVNGEIVTQLGTKVTLDDVVRYNGEIIRNEKPQYLLLNKPKDYITTMDDPQDRRTVMSLIAGACKERVYPVGRLDRNTTGVLLFTNDGDLAKKLTHPSYEIQKIYHVELDRNLKPEDMQAIREGVKLEDGIAMVDDIQFDAGYKDKSQVGVEIHSGRNRIVRRIFEHLEYQVVKLDRVVFAGLTKKDLTRGRWRLLTEMEVNNLKMMTARIDVKKKEKRPRINK